MYSNDSSFAEGFIAGQNGANRNDGMFGDGNGWWAIILFAMIFGWGNGGWGGWGNGLGNNAGLQGAVTRADLCSEFNFNGLENAVRGIQSGLCDGFYAVNTSLLNGFHGVDNAICNLGYQTQQGFNQTNIALMQGQNALQAQLADCCCKVNNNLERGFADTNYNIATQVCDLKTQMASNTRDIIDSQQAGTRAVLDYLCQEKISDLQQENQTLRLAASQERQNNYLIEQLRPAAKPAYLTCSPFASAYGFGYGYGGYPFNNNCGCGCNSGCGC